MSRQHNFPFTAIVGQAKMRTGLLLNAVDPGIGGFLISGHKGTGKSTAVRALAEILPKITVVQGCPYLCSPEDQSTMCSDCAQKTREGEVLPSVIRSMPLVELPLNATEDRVVGTLNIEQAVKSWESKFEPGLLAAANRGILYVDEVNLLNDHIVDILLDSAATGVNVVEREGISYVHPARFILVGTMNPEEGELRPQFLDRFGLSLSVGSTDDATLRQQVVTRRIAFDKDPATFAQRYGENEKIVSNQILVARNNTDSIHIPQEMIALAVNLSAEVGAQGHRSDIAIVKTARALAALLEEKEVRKSHVFEAARYVLPHRIANVPLATAENIEKILEDTLAKFDNSDNALATQDNSEAGDNDWEDFSEQVPGSTAASNVDMLFSFLEEKKKLSSMPMN